MRPAPERKTARRWCVPNALVYDSRELLPGMLLDEFRSPFGVYLWQRVRDVMLWAETPAASRSSVFATGAAAYALPCAPADFPGAAVDVFTRLLTEPQAMPAPEVARAAEAVAAWASARHAFATALAYTQAAALVLPGEPERARATGRAAAEAGQDVRAETWFRRAVGLARRNGDWIAHVRGLVELGRLREQQGNAATARFFFRRALGQARRSSVPALKTDALHGLLRLAMRDGRMDDAVRYGRAARRAARGGSPELRHDLAELAVERGAGAPMVPVLLELLTSRTGAERRHTLRLLCRAVAQAENAAVLESAWPAVEELGSEQAMDRDVAAVLLELARQAAAGGAVNRAGALARAVQRNAEDVDAAQAAETVWRNLFP